MIYYIVQKNGEDFMDFHDEDKAVAMMNLGNATEEDTFTVEEVNVEYTPVYE